MKSMLSILLSIVMGIVCETPLCLASSTRVQTRSCVNLGEQSRIWVAPEVHRKFSFRAVTFVTIQQLSSILS